MTGTIPCSDTAQLSSTNFTLHPWPCSLISAYCCKKNGINHHFLALVVAWYFPNNLPRLQSNSSSAQWLLINVICTDTCQMQTSKPPALGTRICIWLAKHFKFQLRSTSSAARCNCLPQMINWPSAWCPQAACNLQNLSPQWSVLPSYFFWTYYCFSPWFQKTYPLKSLAPHWDSGRSSWWCPRKKSSIGVTSWGYAGTGGCR